MSILWHSPDLFIIYFLFFTAFHTFALENKLIDSEDAELKKNNFVVSIRINKLHISTGCLISDQHVITTAKCILKIIKTGGKFCELATVFLGTNDVSSNELDYTIRQVDAYPQYNPYIPASAGTFNVGCIMVGSLFGFDFPIKIVLDLNLIIINVPIFSVQ